MACGCDAAAVGRLTMVAISTGAKAEQGNWWVGLGELLDDSGVLVWVIVGVSDLWFH